MYRFKITKLDEGKYRFELGAIRLIMDGFSIQNERHLITNPNKAIGYFNIDGNIYGLSNSLPRFDSAEAFYDTMSNQYRIYTSHLPEGRNNFRKSA